jgi:YHS domain-containing protein
MRALLVSTVLVALATAACGGAQVPAPPVPPAATAAASGSALPPGVKKPGEAQVGDKTLCPVSGEEFTVTATSPKTEYKGKTVYFCCSGCSEKFQANPDEFMKKYEGS